MTISDMHTKHFNERLNIADFYSLALMENLKTKKHFTTFRKSAKEEDLDGIDWWVTYPGETKEVPIQFKIRDKQKDIPICRYQPFHGLDHARTVEGRDYRCLRDKKVNQYYVAVRNAVGQFTEIYKISSKTLNSLIVTLDKEWAKVEGIFDMFPPKFFDGSRVSLWLEKGIRNKCVFRNESGCEVWWKKNYNEKSPKFNMYVPYSAKEWGLFLSAEDAHLIEENYTTLAN